MTADKGQTGERNGGNDCCVAVGRRGNGAYAGGGGVSCGYCLRIIGGTVIK